MEKMEKTPNSLRKQVVILGKVNAGKSTLVNALTGQEIAIVSPEAATTTDPVRTAMELIPFGPIVLIDTAGTNDNSPLGNQRLKRTQAVMRRADVAIYVIAADAFDEASYTDFLNKKIPHLVAITKCELADDAQLATFRKRFENAVCLHNHHERDLLVLKTLLAKLLASQTAETPTLIGDLLPPASTIIMVIPIDASAPKGRLILPQVQLLRDGLDHNINCLVVKDTQLANALKTSKKVDLVVTDSQAFATVDRLVPKAIPLTSFSMLLARQKGDFNQLLQGVKAVKNLPVGARILMLEGCTHNQTHEDIGRVKIPALLAKKTGKNFQFEYYSGYDFPDDLPKYDFVIQCGSCMINSREILARLQQIRQNRIPVTNYGILLAYLMDTLTRSVEIFATPLTKTEVI